MRGIIERLNIELNEFSKTFRIQTILLLILDMGIARNINLIAVIAL